MERKYIGKWVEYPLSDGNTRMAKITSIEFNELLGENIFHLVSPFGNHLRLTRSEISRIL